MIKVSTRFVIALLLFLNSINAYAVPSNQAINTMDLSLFAKLADLAPYAKITDLSSYAKAVDLTPYAKTSDLIPYAKLTDVAAVPNICLQKNDAVSITGGSYTWTFPNTNCTFTSIPRCWFEIQSTSTLYVYSYPITTAKTSSSITVTILAALKTINISVLGAVNLWVNPPAGSTMSVTCVAVL